MQTKWNQFVYLLCEAKKKNVEENDYHSLIEHLLRKMAKRNLWLKSSALLTNL